MPLMEILLPAANGLCLNESRIKQVLRNKYLIFLKKKRSGKNMVAATEAIYEIIERSQENNTIPKDVEISIQQVGAIESELDSFRRTTAAGIKRAFGIIQTNDSHYLNYDKRKLKNFIDDNINDLKATFLLLFRLRGI